MQRTRAVQIRIAFNSSTGLEEIPAFPALFGAPVPDLPGAPLPLALADPTDGCQVNGDPKKWAGRAVLVGRGGCSFAEKARVAQAGNATLLIIYNDVPGTPSSAFRRQFLRSEASAHKHRTEHRRAGAFVSWERLRTPLASGRYGSSRVGALANGTPVHTAAIHCVCGLRSTY